MLLKEVQQIRLQIKQLQRYNEEKLYQEATVITGTPVGLLDANIPQVPYATLIIDEAGQCLAPMAFSLLPLARKWVFAGDHLQLPPTVISEQAAKAGLATSALELLVPCCNEVYLLNVQYRMRQRIAGFSSAYFYNNALQAASHLQASTALDFTFIDTAGTGFEETSGADGLSLMNIGELQVANAIIASLT
ncbi:MAG TPA: IGHMBP2 family helicase, partial [Chitinophagaceae bacterium]|nr:IGHMBP2 family helicase [Chitinophagaceae bacterium]